MSPKVTLPDYSKYDDEYLSDYKDIEKDFDPGLPFQDIPVTESEDDEPPGPPPVIISRNDWGAEEGGPQRTFMFPVENVIYSYTETDVCTNRKQCLKLMKQMQEDHIKQGFPDIKYNFVIGGDGKVYEGTGWYVRSPFNEAYPDLEGETIEFAHTGRRGNFPLREKVKLINSLYDYGIANNKIAHDARVCIDYMWDTQ